VSRATPPNFQRDVHCIFGLPFDAVTEAAAVRRVQEAARDGTRLFLSTPNLNFAVGCIGDEAFRQSVVNSDLCTADGTPIVWLARLMGVPLPERVSGAGIFDRLAETPGHRVAVYFFGGTEGTAEQAAQRLEASGKPGVRAVGFCSPGYAPLESITGAAFTAPIDACGTEFVVVALGARKGQAWIEANWPALKAPVISHLGAVVNFVAGTVRRSPVWLQRLGLEWLWRVKEEPALWRRYWSDGRVFLRHLLTGALPLALFNRPQDTPGGPTLTVEAVVDGQGTRLRLVGEAANGQALVPLRQALTQACARGGRVQLDLEGVTRVDSGFVALAQLLDGWQRGYQAVPVLDRVPTKLARVLGWSGAGYLLERASVGRDAATTRGALPRT
jgi:N-acetylglucosaminyldiphosphoundecaprenol N-acetyl-beta-D-mannosaminyltransferase